MRAYKRVAEIIIEERKRAPIKSSHDLSVLIGRHIRPFKKGIHPATLVFQAIRIEVNQELEVLKKLLKAIDDAELSETPETIVAIISFHSLEDRIVKQAFKAWATRCICDAKRCVCLCGNNHQKGRYSPKNQLSRQVAKSLTINDREAQR